MTKPSHPPIPPNCTHFKLEEIYCLYKDAEGREHESSKHEWFFHVSPSLASTYPTVNAQSLRVGMESDATHRKEQRNVIASVARCAWLDDMAMLGLSYVNTLDEADAYYEAKDNANAWAAWGRGDKWE